MALPALLIPLRLDAMVVNRHPSLFVRTPRNYLALCQTLSPESIDFPNPTQMPPDSLFGSQPAQRGVYLMWTLPMGLRRGRQTDGGTVRFPLAPNRWVVARWGGAPAAAGAASWGIESDYLGADGSNTFVKPGGMVADIANLGRSTPLAPGTAWTPPTGPDQPFLTAVGPGDPGFALFQAGMNDVFSFHDAFDSDQALTYSYAVIGWYDQPGADALADLNLGATLAKRLEALGWSAPAGIGTEAQSLFHGAVFGVKWDPSLQADMTPIGRTEAKTAAAVANTGIDGLKAFVAAAPAADIDPDLLEAFQYGMLDSLDQPGADAAIDAARRKAAFLAEPGGVVWEVVNAGTDETSAPRDALTADQIKAEADLLRQLNSDQSKLDAANRRLKTLRRRLLEIWWKSSYLRTNPAAVRPVPDLAPLLDPSQPASLPAQIRQLLADIADIAQRLPRGRTSADLKASIAARTALLAPWRDLKALPRAPFYTPVPPVVLVAGVNHDIDPLNDDALACRGTDQVVTAVAAPGFPPGTGLTAAAAGALAPSWTLGPAPAAAAALLDEAFLLDPDNAAEFAARLLGPAGQAAAVTDALVKPVPLAGRMPSVWPAPSWQQPWLPLYVDWQVQWTGIPFAQWRFDGQDYRWLGHDAAAGSPPVSPQVISGRSFLAPQQAFVFARRLKKFADDHPGAGDEGAISQAMQTACGWDILTQSLSGLTDHIALRDPRPHLAPDDQQEIIPGSGLTMAKLIGDAPAAPPQSALNPKIPHHGDVTPPYFDGLRAGQFSIRHLRILDRFGLSLDLLGPDVIRPAPLAVADDLRTDTPLTSGDDGMWVTLPPRLLQAARLRFDFADQTADGSLKTLLPGDPGDPIGGWILPNRMDHALAAYAADGTYLGELARSADGGGLVWLPDPGAPKRTLDDVAAAAPDLGGMLKGLQAQGIAAYDAFRAVVDESLWTIEPLGARKDELVSALVGRPLAVVRCALSMELAEDALREPSWPSTLDPPAPTLPTLELPVRLGDLGRRADGLIGYFETGNFTTFHSVHDPALAAGEAGAFITQIGPDGYLKLSVDAAPKLLSLLVDPRAKVGATTGLLPLTEVSVPQRFVEPAMRRLILSIRTGPVLAPLAIAAGRDGATVPALRLPVPASRAGGWTWNEAGLTLAIVQADQSARLQEPAVLRDGYLVLTDGLGTEG